VESVFNSYPVDYANSYYSRPYAILGARIGYAPPKQPGEAYQWEAFFEGKNLTNAKYAAVVNPVYNAGGQDVSAFYPGDGLAFTAGLAFRY
jgi:iron complex outermembrane receptor protein